jgi:two-component system, OmpR family, KDP operon response regulator KdpE
VVNSSTDRKRQVLVVEDEAAIRELLRLHLALGGFEVAEVTDGARALAVGRTTRFDLIVLDVMLPGIDGVTLCRAYRSEGVNLATPILMLTARDTESDKVLGLESGADDYLTKPFGIGELLARVRALLRRSEGAASGEQVITVGELSIDLPHRVVTAAGNEVHLTPTEFDLLKELALAEGRPLTHKMLLRSVWGPGYAQEMQLLRTHMGRLRDKLEENGVPRTSIETLTGVGYRLRG